MSEVRTGPTKPLTHVGAPLTTRAPTPLENHSRDAARPHRQPVRCTVAARIGICTVCLLLGLAGCASPPERAAQSSVGCAKAVVAALPAELTDPERHCVASAGIALRCSRFEAWLAGWGKEIEDTFGHGDASLEDLDADRMGRRCASTHHEPYALIECCRQALTARDLTEDQRAE